MSHIGGSRHVTISDVAESTTDSLTKENAHRSYAYLVKQPSCNKCGDTDPSHFQYRRKNQCIECRKKEKRLASKIKQSDPAYAIAHNQSVNAARQRTYESFVRMKLNRISTKAGVKLNIADVMSIYTNQCGKCAISKIAMTHTMKCLRSLSIDRINNNLGYTIDNVQLVCKFVNLGRRQFNIDEFIDIAYNNNQPLTYTNDEIKQWMQRRRKVIQSRCSSKINLKRKQLTYDVTLQWLCDKFTQQNGLCTMTGTPMTIKHEALDSCSIDRIDNSIGYHDGNIQLVCLWANTARSSAGVPELLGVLREAGMRSI